MQSVYNDYRYYILQYSKPKDISNNIKPKRTFTCIE